MVSACFDMENTLPVSLAHSMVAVICNLKLWLNYASVIQLFIPFRSRVMKYMCRLEDKELRTPAVRTMAGMLKTYTRTGIIDSHLRIYNYFFRFYLNTHMMFFLLHL